MNGDQFSGALARDPGENIGTTYAINQGTLTAGTNYSITYIGANFAITAMPITVTANAGQSKVYGTTDPTLTYSVTSGALVNGDQFTGLLARAPGENIGTTYAISQGSLTAGTNYTITYVGANFAITAAPLTVTATAGQSKVYGTTDPTFAYSVTSGALVKGDQFSGALARDPGENVGTTYAINQGSLTAGTNYAITYVGANFAITAAPLTVTATAGQSKVYGTTDPTFTYSVTSGALVNGDQFTGALARDPGENIGTTYAINQGTLTAGTNYTITYVGANFAITAAPLTVTANPGQSKVYGTTDPTFTYSVTSGALVNGDQFTGALARDPGENIGTTYAINQGSLTAGTNYAITYVGANFAITAAPITVTATAGQSKVYGTTDPTFTYSVTSGALVNGDQFTGALARDPGENIGTTYAINQGSLTAGTNYTITYVGANFAITAAPITVTATAGQSKLFGTADPTFAYSVTSGALVNGDQFTGALARDPGESVGNTYAINQGTLTAGSNYTITYVGANFAITSAAITVTATAGQSKVYGTTDPTLTYSITSGALLNGDQITGTLARAPGENVGTTYAISQGSLTAGPNYTITYVGANFAITAAPLTVTATAGQSKVYGTTDPTFTYSVTSGALVNGDQFSGALARDPGENIGTTYAINQGSLTAGTNYAITYVGANFAITAAPLTVTATAGQSKVYGTTDPTFTYSVTSGALVNGDQFTGTLARDPGENIGTTYAINQGSLTAGTNYAITFVGANFAITAAPLTVTATTGQSKVYGTTDPTFAYSVTSGALVNGDQFSGALARDPGENIGTTYAINQGTLTAGTNYTITYAGANFAITAAPLTVTATAGQSKVYGTTDPTFAYSVTSGALVNGDQFSGALARDPGENVGTTYAINQGSLTAGSNYTITYVGANFAITAAPMTVTANAGQSKVYGTTDPTLTYSVTTGALVNGDQFTGGLVRAPGENVGTTYAISQGTLTAGSNYTMTYVGANFAITAAPLTVTANPGQSKVYGATDPALTYSVTSGALVNGDQITGTLVRNPGETVASYAINQGSLTVSSNYALTYVGANFAITAAPLTITANSTSKIFGSTLTFVGTEFTTGASQLLNGDAVNSVTLTSAGAISSAPATTYSIVASLAAGTGLSNYAINYVNGTLTVIASSDATLSALGISAGTLSPSFGSAITSYSVSVSSPTATITVTPTTNDIHASVKVNGATVTSGSPSSPIALTAGAVTPITVTTLANDGTTTKTYTINVTRAATNNASLSVVTLTPSTTLVNAGTVGNTTTYTTTAANATASVTVTPTAGDPNATIKVNGATVATGTASGPISLGTEGTTTTINTVITSEDGTVIKTYAIVVTRAPSSNASLSTIALTPYSSLVNAGTVGSTTTFTATAANATTSVTVTPTVVDVNATVKVNGTTVASGTPSTGISLGAEGSTTTINTVVTAQDGTTKTYAIVVTRAPSNNASLSSITLTPASTLVNTGTVGNTTTYTTSVVNATASVKVTPTAADANATIKVNGVTVASGTASGSIALAEGGTTTINTVVISQDGTVTKTYSIVVTRAVSTDATLSNLAPSSGSVSPTFVSGTKVYTETVPNAITNITVTPTANDANTQSITVTANGTTTTVASGTPSPSILLAEGINTAITVTVTAQDGTTKATYSLTVSRSASPDATLSNLVPSTGTLAPVFAAGTTSYTVSVPYATTSIAVTPTINDPNAKSIMVNGVSVASGTASGSIALAPGALTTINTVVTAQDGTTTKTYAIVVTRGPSSNASLSTIALAPYSTLVNAGTVGNTTTYTTSVTNAVASVTVTPTAGDPNATIKVNGVTVASGASSGSIALAEGTTTTINTVVLAQDGTTTKTYSIVVTRAPSSNASLTTIVLNPASTLTNTGTVGSTTTYTTSVVNATASVTVTPTAGDANATIKVNGVTVASGAASGSISLPVGQTTINTVVIAQDGTTKTYAIVVTRAKSSNANLLNLAVSGATLAPVFASSTVSYTTTVANATTSVTVTPTVSDGTATIKVNGTTVASGAASTSIPLGAEGSTTTITTVVTAQDGTTTKTYSVAVKRAPSTNASLTSIALTPTSSLTNAGTVGTTTTYTTSVSNATTSVKVTGIVQDVNATIKVNGVTVASGVASQSFPLAVGQTTITTIVTAQDGTTTRIYFITITRATGPLLTLHQPIQPEISVTKPTDTVAIENDGVMVHQGVSPNGDGINDFLTIDGISAYPNNRFTIIDRNGSLVYEVKGYDNTSRMFDGHSNINGKLQQPGTYFYSLDYVVNGQTKHKTGFIILKY